MRKILSLIAAGMMLVLPVAPVLAGENSVENPVVVELFSSQGCASCPPADELLRELAARDDVLALAMHVDYWDYIGWKDSFADPAYTARQRAYAKSGGRRMIYTPQMIINGQDHVVGNRSKDVTDMIERHKSMSPYVDLEITRIGNSLSISAEAARPLDDALTVQLIRYRPQASVNIKRGENAGRVLSYVNIVTELRVLQEWDTRAPLTLETQVTGDQPVVVLLQHEGYGAVAAVARLR